MASTDKRYYLSAEVAEMLNLPASTLRWWEREISQLQPRRTNGGHRRYSTDDVELLRRIKELVYDGGLSIRAAAEFLENSVAPKRPPGCNSVDDALKLLARLSVIVKANPKALAMIKSLESYLRQT